MISAAAPFLSVITRTQGRRPHTLPETLASLAAQTDPDLELLLIAHRAEPDARADFSRLLDRLPVPMRARSRLIPLDHGTRTTPLNLGLAQAGGAYVTVLDDDDLVLPHWLATFRRMAAEQPGRVLRAGSRQQRVRTELVDGRPALRVDGPLESVFPDQFDIFDHLLGNHTPPQALAFPLAGLRAHGIAYDETLTTAEDWDFILRAVGPLGIATTPEVTSIYRWWTEGESSRTQHAEAEWRDNYRRISDRWNDAPLVLPPGSLFALRDLISQARAAAAATTAQRRDQAGLAREVEALLHSRSWRITRPLRAIAGPAGDATGIPADLETMPAADLERFLAELRASLSWRVTAPLRRWAGARLSRPAPASPPPDRLR